MANQSSNTKRNTKGTKVANAAKQAATQGTSKRNPTAKRLGVPLQPSAVINVPAQVRKMQRASAGGWAGWPKTQGTGAAARYALVVAHHGKTYGQLCKAWQKQAAQQARGIAGYSAGGEVGYCLGHAPRVLGTYLATLTQPKAQQGTSKPKGSTKGSGAPQATNAQPTSTAGSTTNGTSGDA